MADWKTTTSGVDTLRLCRAITAEPILSTHSLVAVFYPALLFILFMKENIKVALLQLLRLRLLSWGNSPEEDAREICRQALSLDTIQTRSPSFSRDNNA